MFDFTLRDITKTSPSICLLTLENQSKRDFRFTAGQYVAIHFKRRGRPTPARCFSIVSSPHQPNVVQIAAKVTGDFTFSLSELTIGETVYVQGPFGDFVMDYDYDSNLVFLAAGIGITPYLSMLLYLAQIKATKPVTLIYSISSSRQVPFEQQLRALQRRYSHLKVIFVTTNNKRQGENGFVDGRVDQAFIASLVRQLPTDSTYFLCGPSGFMNNVSSSLAKQGINEDRLIMEAFGQHNMGAAHSKNPLPRQVYVITAASVLLGTGILAANNLLGSAQAATTNKAAAPTTPASTSQTPSATPSASSTTTPAAPAPSTTPTATQTYQQPVSTVS